MTWKRIADNFSVLFLTQPTNASKMNSLVFWNGKPMMGKFFKCSGWRSIIGVSG